MSQTQSNSTSGASTDDDQNYELDSIGIELEYPQASQRDTVPATNGSMARGIFQQYRDTDWLPDFGGDSGYVGSDHCGAEITSGVLDLHSDEPEVWYRSSIEEAESAGYRFAATGYGSSKFGLHMHVSDLYEDDMDTIEAACQNEWARVFFCASVNADSMDPWRHYRSSSPSSPWRTNRRGETGHQEFRVPEPVLPEHFGLVMDFWRKVEIEGADAAVDFARELVMEKDERLTPIVQYNQLCEEIDDYPTEYALESDSQTSTFAAQWFADHME